MSNFWHFIIYAEGNYRGVHIAILINLRAVFITCVYHIGVMIWKHWKKTRMNKK